MIDETLSTADGKMQKSIQALRRELETIRTGRATPVLVDSINVDAYGVGPVWGTGLWEVDAGEGLWESSFTGYMYADGSLSVRGVCHGIEGSVEGLKMFFTVEYPAWGVLPGTVSGRILDPHGD